MYLRHTTIRKDGKVHRYWRVVRSVRVGRRVIQQTVAQLGELDEQGRVQARALAHRLKKHTVSTVPAPTKLRSISAVCAAPKSASTITLLARICFAMRRSPHGERITAASRMAIR